MHPGLKLPTVRRVVPRVLLVLALAVLMAACSNFKEHLVMKDAAKDYKSQKYLEAAKKFEKALAINPKRADNWKYLGYSYYSLVETGNSPENAKEYTKKALEAFQRYLDIVGKDDDLQDFIINLYVNQNRLEDGVEYYKVQLGKNPGDARIIQTIAMLYTRMGDFDNSLKYSEMKAQLTPDDPAGFLFIGALCWEQSHRHKELPPEERGAIADKGLTYITKALEIDPNSVNGYVFEGLLYRVKKDVAESQARLAKKSAERRELEAQAKEFLTKAEEAKVKALALRKVSKGESKPDGEGVTPPSNP